MTPLRLQGVDDLYRTTGTGATFAEMGRLGLPVPGLTISTEICAHYYANKGSYPNGLRAAVRSRARDKIAT
jgi:pyruvate,orthophosphate dikinase